jgi:hypothetical protein
MSIIANLNSSRAALAALVSQQTALTQQIQTLQSQLATLTMAVNQAQATFNAATAAYQVSQVQVADVAEVTALQNQLVLMGATPVVVPTS